MAVDHDKKKVVISIRGTLSPKVCCLWRPAQPSQPLRPARLPLPVLTPALACPLCPQGCPDGPDRGRRAPPRGGAPRHLAGTQGTPPSGPQRLLASSATLPARTPVLLSGGSSCLLGPQGEVGQRGLHSSRRSTVAQPPGSPQSCLAQVLSQKSLKRQTGKDWFL